jgi:hypothetical protein
MTSTALPLTTPALRCASPFASRLATAHGRREENVAPCTCGLPCPAAAPTTTSWLRRSAETLPTALIISGSSRCFDRAKVEVSQRGGFASVDRIAAEFIDENTTLAKCCKNKCGRGRRSKPSHRARVDGIAQAHRRAWAAAVADGHPRVVFEDDIEALGDSTQTDVAYAIRRCETSACGVAFLGVAFAFQNQTSYLLSHAYYVSPYAASLLLRITRSLCNERGQDYHIASLCARRRVNCTLPPRGLYTKGTQGWGLFVQNTRRVPAYNSLINFARGKNGASNWTRESAERFHRC